MPKITIIHKRKPYSLEEDHKAIKKQIKRWERKVDMLIKKIGGATGMQRIVNELDEISQEMMAINI